MVVNKKNPKLVFSAQCRKKKCLLKIIFSILDEDLDIKRRNTFSPTLASNWLPVKFRTEFTAGLLGVPGVFRSRLRSRVLSYHAPYL